MPIKCEVLIKEFNFDKKPLQIKLYCRADGQPEKMGLFLLDTILPKLQESNEECCNSIANYLIKEHDFIVTVYNHLDIHYRYYVDIPKKEIYCYKGRYALTSKNCYSFKKKEKINLNELIPLKIENFYL